MWKKEGKWRENKDTYFMEGLMAYPIIAGSRRNMVCIHLEVGCFSFFFLVFLCICTPPKANLRESCTTPTICADTVRVHTSGEATGTSGFSTYSVKASAHVQIYHISWPVLEETRVSKRNFNFPFPPVEVVR